MEESLQQQQHRGGRPPFRAPPTPPIFQVGEGDRSRPLPEAEFAGLIPDSPRPEGMTRSAYQSSRIRLLEDVGQTLLKSRGAAVKLRPLSPTFTDVSAILIALLLVRQQTVKGMTGPLQRSSMDHRSSRACSRCWAASRCETKSSTRSSITAQE